MQADSSFADKLDSFVYVSVDYNNIRNTEWPDRLGVKWNQSYLLFIYPSGEEITRLEGDTELNEIDDEMRTALRNVRGYVSSQIHYLTTIRGASERSSTPEFAAEMNDDFE